MNPAVTRLDLYLAATMRSCGGLTQVLRQWDVTNANLDEERRAANEAGFSDPARVTIESVEERFGPPTLRKADALVYDLTMWPSHAFRWGIYSGRYASHEGFVLKVPRSPVLPIGNWTDSVEQLRTWHDTQAEVQDAFGEPSFESTWGSTSEWIYESKQGGADLLCEFDYGLLIRILNRSGLAAEYRAHE